MRQARAPRRLAVGLALGCLGACFGVSAGAEPLVRGRFTTVNAKGRARDWAARGLDVVEGSVTPRTLELIAPRAALEHLRDAETLLEVLEVGHPRSARPVNGDDALLAVDEPATVPATYETYEAIIARMTALCARRPGECQVVDLTATYGASPTFEGRHLQGVKLSDNVAQAEDEPTVLLVAGHHARELGTPVVALAALAHLLDGYGSDPEVTATVDDNELWVVPVGNPDGYDYVFSTDNLWRKNRRPVDTGVGVDLNRNYPFGWDSACSGGTVPEDETYKGPTAVSEAETQTMVLFAGDRRFAKVLDFHSAGREVVVGTPCHVDPLAAFRTAEAGILATLAGYSGATRLPATEGQHEQFEAVTFGAHAFLLEVGEQFQPEFSAAAVEAEQVWPAIAWMLRRPISVDGHVTDACTGVPVVADIAVTELAFTSGETNRSGGPFGRYHLFLPAGNHTLRFTAPGYRASTAPIAVTDNAALALPIALIPVAPCGGDAGPPARVLPPHAGRLHRVAPYAEGDGGCACATTSSAPPRGSSLLIAVGLFGLGYRRRRRYPALAVLASASSRSSSSHSATSLSMRGPSASCSLTSASISSRPAR